MSRFRDFDAARAEGEPLTFRLAGQDFTTVTTIPAGPLLEMSRALADEDTMGAFATFSRFFEAIVPDDQHEAFAAAVRSVDLATVLDVLAWVIQESTGRPLDSPSPSAVSSSPNGASSKLDAASAAWGLPS